MIDMDVREFLSFVGRTLVLVSSFGRSLGWPCIQGHFWRNQRAKTKPYPLQFVD